jgi:hypothetical protein
MRIESSPKDRLPAHFGIFEYPPGQIAHHARILMQEGLIEGQDLADSTGADPDAIATSLTWKGHEFLDLARDQQRWNRAKAIIGKVGGAPISVWTKVLTDLMLPGVDKAASRPN